ncbi:MBL fold hydrolase [Parapedobacter pyrenivorans]|uniref:MBL fold hydrolase n=1 Tax=Parapedobacter pyrenivorans TaxID=1305674 RepID=A0A917M8S9_9SPHI|nr:MBL fold metallo-hydrolase [Parapedobacter pyrenivorans]GGG84907.1 MBL fold hydrolase [Parapedobacter pyrenivorans]
MKKIKKHQHTKLQVLAVSLGILLQTNGAFAQTLFFERVFDESLAQASYVIGSLKTREAIVIDPKRDIDTYLKIAESNNLQITRVAETHIHADFLSGSQELATATGAELLLSAAGGKEWQYEFDHIPLNDGDRIDMGKLLLQVMHTPGHTPESITFLLIDPAISEKPQKALTGDFVFVGDVGRPDLLEMASGQIGTAEEGAKQLYRSIQRFSELPDGLEIWPGHSAGSFCGRSLSDIPQSTLEQEKLLNKAFQYHGDEGGFVDYVLDGQPSVPTYFAVMKQLNKARHPLLIEIPNYPKLSDEAFLRAWKNGLQVVDTRNKDEVANGFIPGSVHIEGSKSFATWVGSLLDYQQQLILVVEDERLEAITRQLMRIGMDNIYGYVSEIERLGIALERPDIIDLHTFKALKNKNNVQVIDVRTEAEYQAGHIQGAENIPLPMLEANLNKVSKEKQIIVHCQSGARSAVAYSILRKHGFENISNFSGGMNAWLAKDKERLHQ